MAVIKKWRLKKKYALLTIILSAVVLFTLVLGMSYAFFTTRVTSKELVIYTGSLRVEFNNNGNGINLNGTKPMTNTEGLSTDGYAFNIKNTGTIKARYQVRIELENDNEIPLEYIKMSYMQTKQENNVTDEPASDPILLSNLNKSLVFIQNEKIDPLKEDSFNLKLWLDISTPNDMQGKTFKAKIIVDAIQDVDEGYVFTSSPIIKLNKDENGNINQNLKVGDTYTDLGVMSVEDDKDNLDVENVVTEIEYFDGSDITTVNSIDTSVVGIYYINYSITDSDNKTGRAIRVITVNNTNTIPTITLNGSSTMTAYQGVTFNDPGATSEGNKVITVGYVDINTLGTYIIKYIVVDNNGNTNSITRTVNVEETLPVTLYSAAVDEIYYYDNNNQKVVLGTTDENGTLDTALPLGSVTLYSSVAKSITNLSNPYSKSFDGPADTMYLMPDNVLYWYGNEMLDITGGWDNVTLEGGNQTSGTKEDTYFHVDSKSVSGMCQHRFITQNPINLTSYSSLKIISSGYTYNLNSGVMIEATPDKLTSWRSTDYQAYHYPDVDTQPAILTYSISSKSGNFYVRIGHGYGNSTGADTWSNLYAAWLE